MNNTYVDRILTCFADHAPERRFVILIDPLDDTQFVQFLRRGGTIYAEVSSRQWGPADGRRPLNDQNELALMRTGFSHGGPGKNYAQDGLTADGPYLAGVSRQAFATAYGQPLPERPLVVTDVDELRQLVTSAGGDLQPVSARPRTERGFLCPVCEQLDPFAGPGRRTGAGLLARARRATRSNFVQVQLDCQDHVVMVGAVRHAKSFDDLPEQVQDWVLKAEEGPLRP